MYKINNNLSTEIIQNLFVNNTQNNYNLRSKAQFKVPVPKSVHYGTETFSYLGPKIMGIST